MGIFDFLKPKQNTASIAKNRLQILVAQNGPRGGSRDYLSALRQDIIIAISKHVSGFNPEDLNVEVHKDGDQDVLDITVSLPDDK